MIDYACHGLLGESVEPMTTYVKDLNQTNKKAPCAIPLPQRLNSNHTLKIQ